MTGMRVLVAAGIIFALCGIAALVHPRVFLPAQKSDTKIGSDRYIIETRRIVTIPAFEGVLAIVIGGGLIFLGTRKS